MVSDKNRQATRTGAGEETNLKDTCITLSAVVEAHPRLAPSGDAHCERSDGIRPTRTVNVVVTIGGAARLDSNGRCPRRRGLDGDSAALGGFAVWSSTWEVLSRGVDLDVRIHLERDVTLESAGVGGDQPTPL